MKKVICALLSLVMLFSCCSVAFATDYDTYTTIPNIYFQGQGSGIVTDEGETVYSVSVPDGYILDKVKELLPVLLDAIKTGDWTEYRAGLVDAIAPIYEKIQLDTEGNPRYGTHVNWSWSAAGIKNTAAACKGKYDIRSFNYYMDWRLDPYDIVDDFNNYIEAVKTATGCDKVNLISRCESNAVILAYFEKYGTDSVNCYEAYITSVNGCEPVSALFSGKFQLDQESLLRFKEESLDLSTMLDDPAMAEFLEATISLLSEVYVVEGVVDILEPVFMKIYKEAMTDAIFYSYGSFPGIWGLVENEDYDRAMQYMFRGRETEYAGLINKINYSRDHVFRRVDDIMLKAAEDGVKIAVYAKYNYDQMYPYCEENNETSDGVITLALTSLGATVADYSEVLTDKYISAAEKNGNGKYISPDRKVDASTCLFPETTWIIFNSGHRDFPDTIHNDLMMKFLVKNGELTVSDDPNLPQYIYCADEADGCGLSPMTAENGFQTVEKTKPTKKSIKTRFAEFLKNLITIIRNYLVNAIKNIKIGE